MVLSLLSQWHFEIFFTNSAINFIEMEAIGLTVIVYIESKT